MKRAMDSGDLAADAKLTRSRRLTAGLSVTAILISLASPVATYYWLQSTVRVQELKAQALRAAGGYSILHNQADPDSTQTRYRVELQSVGVLPVSAVQVAFRQYGRAFESFDEQQIEVDPPRRRKIDRTARDIVIFFDEPIPPGQQLEVLLRLRTGEHDSQQFAGHPYAWVSTEAASPQQIGWQSRGGAGW